MELLCDPGEIRTRDPLVKSQVHLPTELQSHLARGLGIEPNHRGFGDLTDTMSVPRLLWNGWVSSPLLWIFSPVQSPDLPPFQFWVFDGS